MSPSTESPLIVLAHGAGAGSGHPWMQRWRDRLAAIGAVESFDYPYMQKGRRGPDRLPVLLEAHREALASARERHAGNVVLAGKSMGGRVGCHLALEEEVAGVVCFGYPLRSAKGALRDEVLTALRVPVLFVQGTRDRLCPLDLLEEVRGRMTAPGTLHVVEGGDHSLEVGKRALAAAGATQDDVDQRIARAVADFVAGL